MTTKPQTIQLFIPDGEPTSIREAEITNRLVKAILFPRNKMQEVTKRKMIHFTGVYFLFGQSEDGAQPKVYIGEGEDCYRRIVCHNRDKDWWTHCVIVTTKTNEYTKTDGKYLEHYCLQQADKVARFTTDNDNGSQKPSISESREYDLLDNFETIKILLATLGYPLFEEKRESKSIKDIFYCKGRDASASGEMTNDGFVVYKGSVFQLKETPGISKWVSDKRTQLINESILKEENNVLLLQSDTIFSSSSGSAACVLGRTANGWTAWKNKEGKTLDEVKRK